MEASKLSEQQRNWLRHIEACTRSGMSMKAYAEQHELDIKRLYDWKRRLVKLGALGSSKTSPGFCKVSTQAKDQACRVYFPNGVVLEWPLSVSVEGLSAIVAAMALT